MDQQFDFRALLLKLQDCLSNNDRRRLHFLVGDLIPRQIRDDPSLGGKLTLNLLESLFDQAKINEQDFDYLIHAFSEIRCYAAVERLKEHQRSQNRTDQYGTILADLMNDDVEDRIYHINLPSSMPSDKPKSTENISKSFDLKNKTDNTHISVKTKKKEEKRHLTYIKQLIKSRLTVFQITLFILNLIGIITFSSIILSVKRRNICSKEFMLVKVGILHGNGWGGESFNDATDFLLTFDERPTEIKSGGTGNEIDYITFTYSNGKSKQHGQSIFRNTPLTYHFILNPNEHINGVTVYTGTRQILNLYQPNGTFLIVGLRFHTNQGRQSELFGSQDGTETNESLPDYQLGYVRGQAYGYVDALQFIWYKETTRMTTALLPIY